MSYDKSIDRNRRLGRESQLLAEDASRMDFLVALAKADVRLTEWEQSFVRGFVKRHRDLQTLKRFGAMVAAVSFTERQRERVDALRQTYGGRL